MLDVYNISIFMYDFNGRIFNLSVSYWISENEEFYFTIK